MRKCQELGTFSLWKAMRNLYYIEGEGLHHSISDVIEPME